MGTNGIPEKKEICGIIMPISASEHYNAEHWIDVKGILDEVINAAGFESQLVSDADEIGIIHNRIVSNVYNNPMIICDVSSKNPNVMFELGLRLAFDKATIIIKDDFTNYNFDTAPIEHLTYPKDLRYSSISKFKLKLKEKLTSTHKASLNPEYSTFLKNFVQYKPKLETAEVSSQEYVLKQLDAISRQISEIGIANKNIPRETSPVFEINGDNVELGQTLYQDGDRVGELIDVHKDSIWVRKNDKDTMVIRKSTPLYKKLSILPF